MDNIDADKSIEELARAMEPIIKVWQDLADTINKAIRAFVEYIERVMAEVCRVLDMRLTDIVALYVELQRETLFVKLYERGAPAWLAHWLAYHCPRQWLPSNEEVAKVLYNG